jgi:hypothetical protein
MKNWERIFFQENKLTGHIDNYKEFQISKFVRLFINYTYAIHV